jgi:hypothetical protein
MHSMELPPILPSFKSSLGFRGFIRIHANPLRGISTGFSRVLNSDIRLLRFLFLSAAIAMLALAAVAQNNELQNGARRCWSAHGRQLDLHRYPEWHLRRRHRSRRLRPEPALERKSLRRMGTIPRRSATAVRRFRKAGCPVSRFFCETWDFYAPGTAATAHARFLARSRRPQTSPSSSAYPAHTPTQTAPSLTSHCSLSIRPFCQPCPRSVPFECSPLPPPAFAKSSKHWSCCCWIWEHVCKTRNLKDLETKILRVKDLLSIGYVLDVTFIFELSDDGTDLRSAQDQISQDWCVDRSVRLRGLRTSFWSFEDAPRMKPWEFMKPRGRGLWYPAFEDRESWGSLFVVEDAKKQSWAS